MQFLFKFEVNRMKIEDFRNSAYVDLLADVNLKNNWLVELFSDLKYKILLKFQVNQMKIEDFRNLIEVVDLLAEVDLKNNWLN